MIDCAENVIMGSFDALEASRTARSGTKLITVGILRYHLLYVS